MRKLTGIITLFLLLELLLISSSCNEIKRNSFGLKSDAANKSPSDLYSSQDEEPTILDLNRKSKNKRIKSNYYKLFNNSLQDYSKNETNKKRELETNENNGVHATLFEDGNETIAHKDHLFIQANSMKDTNLKNPIKEKNWVSFITTNDQTINQPLDQAHANQETNSPSLENKNTYNNKVEEGNLLNEKGSTLQEQNENSEKKDNEFGHSEQVNDSETENKVSDIVKINDTHKNETLPNEPDKILVIEDKNDLFDKDKFLIIDIPEKEFDTEQFNTNENDESKESTKLKTNSSSSSSSSSNNSENSATIRIHSQNDEQIVENDANKNEIPSHSMLHIKKDKNERYKKFTHQKNANFIDNEGVMEDLQNEQMNYKPPADYDISKVTKNENIPEDNLKIDEFIKKSFPDGKIENLKRTDVDTKDKILKEEPRFTEATDNQTCSAKKQKEVPVDPLGKYLSLKFLGLGYDIIIGNPEGEPGLNVDPGFKGPILKLNIENIDKTSMTEEEKQSSITPWIIPEHSCNQSKNVEEINSLEAYKSELSSDVKISTPSNIPYSFSASLEFQNALKKLKLQNTVMFMMKIYCLRYYTGIPLSSSWKFTDHFLNSLNKLPKTFDGLKEGNNCSYENYKDRMDSPECEKNINKWIYFFKIHGTHIAHEIYLGGKIILKINVNKDDYNQMKENNIDIKSYFNSYFTQIGFSFTSKNEDSQVSKRFNMSRNVSILGGNPGIDVEESGFFEKWVNSISKNSMPVQVKLLPFSYFMTDPTMIQAYKDALTFYGLSYGARIVDQERLGKVKSSIGHYLEECTQNLYAGTSPGLLTCPYGTSIFMGFSLNLDFYSKKKLGHELGIGVCDPLKESCSGLANNSKYGDTRIWALCSKNPLEYMVQVTEQGESPGLTATCPPGLVILFGFALMKGMGSSSANNVDIYPCRTGQSSCSAVFQNKHIKQSMIYIACVDNTTVGLKDLQTYSQIKNLGTAGEETEDGYESLTFVCPYKTKLVFGFTIEFHTNFPVARRNFDHCLRVSNACSITGINLNTKTSFFKGDKHSLATVAVCRNEK